MAAVNEGRVKDALMGHTDLLGECPHCLGEGMPVILFRCVTTDELTASRTASFRCDGGQGIASSHSGAMAQRGVRARDDHPDHDAAVFVMLRARPSWWSRRCCGRVDGERASSSCAPTQPSVPALSRFWSKTR
jgi:hypothetical protein